MKPTTWVELCCGSAAVTLRLLGGQRCTPLVPYQGGKRKFSGAILDVLGLRAGGGASEVVLCDAGPWGLVWQQITTGVDLAPYMTGWNELDDDEQAADFKVMAGTWSAIEHPAARAAAWLWLTQRSFGGKGPHAGGVSRRIKMGPKSKHSPWRHTIDAPVPALDRLGDLPWPKTTVHHGDVRDVRAIEGATMYIDSDYRGTTSYGSSLPRADLIALLRRWDHAGAVVVASEAEPLPIPGWHHVEITKARTGTPRNRSRQQREWLTINRPPVVIPPHQFGMFE